MPEVLGRDGAKKRRGQVNHEPITHRAVFAEAIARYMADVSRETTCCQTIAGGTLHESSCANTPAAQQPPAPAEQPGPIETACPPTSDGAGLVVSADAARMIAEIDELLADGLLCIGKDDNATEVGRKFLIVARGMLASGNTHGKTRYNAALRVLGFVP